MLYKTLFLTLSLLFIIEISMGQPPFPTPPINTPIDGGLSLLLATGAAYGAKKVHDFRQKKS